MKVTGYCSLIHHLDKSNLGGSCASSSSRGPSADFVTALQILPIEKGLRDAMEIRTRFQFWRDSPLTLLLYNLELYHAMNTNAICSIKAHLCRYQVVLTHMYCTIESPQ